MRVSQATFDPPEPVREDRNVFGQEEDRAAAKAAKDERMARASEQAQREAEATLAEDRAAALAKEVLLSGEANDVTVWGKPDAVNPFLSPAWRERWERARAGDRPSQMFFESQYGDASFMGPTAEARDLREGMALLDQAKARAEQPSDPRGVWVTLEELAGLMNPVSSTLPWTEENQRSVKDAASRINNKWVASLTGTYGEMDRRLQERISKYTPESIDHQRAQVGLSPISRGTFRLTQIKEEDTVAELPNREIAVALLEEYDQLIDFVHGDPTDGYPKKKAIIDGILHRRNEIARQIAIMDTTEPTAGQPASFIRTVEGGWGTQPIDPEPPENTVDQTPAEAPYAFGVSLTPASPRAELIQSVIFELGAIARELIQ